jgi:hypothetical protein
MAANWLEALSTRTAGRPFERLRSLEPLGFLLYAGGCTLLAAMSFFGARNLHLHWAEAARTALDPSAAARRVAAVWWSAPLDDTFIHFDFARSFAMLRPFEWTHGGGYSSGATSWSYPILLAIGVALGCTGQSLGTLADVIACTSTFAFFWATRSLFGNWAMWASYLLPVFVLTSGVLGWSLWSGMEFALFTAIWGVLAHYYVEFGNARVASEAAKARRGMAFTGLLLVTTRPEALLCSGLFAIFACTRASCPQGNRVRTFFQLVAPSLTFAVIRAITNLVLTGSYADAGALVKLHTLRPFLEPQEMWSKWLDNVGFQFTRISTYHTTDDAAWGWQFWALVVLAWLPKRTRSTVALLTLQALGWILMVAQNEYVRYQNDRYTMPAVLWLLVAVVLGLGGALVRAHETLGKAGFLPRLVQTVVSVLIAGSFIAHQSPRINQQRWLFGRASRNIAEQQVRVGQLLQAGHFGPARRVLVGDAGAIPYFSGLAGIDAIGLGGTRGLPFAKAVNLGIGATVELIERLPPEDRPDRLALYPSWWDLLPVWFGRRLDEVSIKGNVICGAASKVVYEAEWRGLDNGSRPSSLAPGTRILDELDFADLVSESAHGYEISSKHSGYVVMKVLPNPASPSRDLFDAGRLVFADAKARFYLRGFRPGHPASLVFRAAPNYTMAFRVLLDGRAAGRVEVEGGSDWQEPSLELDPKRLRERVMVEIVAETAEHILYHLWATAR